MKDKDAFDCVREIIRHEDGLINQRMTWYLVTQGILFTAYTGSVAVISGEHKSWGPNQIYLAYAANLTLAALGVYISVAVSLAVRGAYEQMDQSVSWYERQVGARSARLPPIRGKWTDTVVNNLFAMDKLAWAIAAVWLVFGTISIRLISNQGGAGLPTHGPEVALAISTVGGTPVTWLWSRYWHRRLQRRYPKEFAAQHSSPAISVTVGLIERAIVTSLVIWLGQAAGPVIAALVAVKAAGAWSSPTGQGGLPPRERYFTALLGSLLSLGWAIAWGIPWQSGK